MGTDLRSKCIDLTGSTLCQHHRTSCYFPNKVVHATFVQWVSQQSCNNLAWDKSSCQAINNINHGRTPAMVADNRYSRWLRNFSGSIHRQSMARTPFLWHWWQCTLRRCCGVCLVSGRMVVLRLQHSLTVVSQLAAKLISSSVSTISVELRTCTRYQ